MTLQVTCEEEIALDLQVENSTVGPPSLVAGHSPADLSDAAPDSAALAA